MLMIGLAKTKKIKPMKAKDLIKELEKVNPEATVVVTTDNFEQGHSTIKASHLYKFKGELKDKPFKDAFDGGEYTSEVAEYDEKGKDDFIQIK